MNIIYLLISLSVSSVVFAADVPVVPPASPVAAGQLAQLAGGLIFVVCLIFGGAYLLRRFGVAGGSANGKLKVVAGMSLGGRDRIALIQVGEEQVLVGVSPGRIQTLHVMQEPVVIEEVKGFAKHLSVAREKQEQSTNV